MTAYDEEKLAELLHSLPPAPEGWVEAAQELPFLRAQLDDIVQRAEADAEFRRALMADLETALAEAGYEPSDRLVRELRTRLSR
jgi:type VI protein secretion system component VasF